MALPTQVQFLPVSRWVVRSRTPGAFSLRYGILHKPMIDAAGACKGFTYLSIQARAMRHDIPS